TTETKLRRRSRSSMAHLFINPLNRIISFNFQISSRSHTSGPTRSPPMRAAVPVPVTVSPSLAAPLPVMVAAFCLIWSSAFAISRLAILDCPPLLLLALRCLVAGVILLAAARIVRGGQHFTRRDLVIYAALGIANYTLYLGMNYVGMAGSASA